MPGSVPWAIFPQTGAITLGYFWAGREGRGPVQAGSESHSAHRMRRSSSPTLIKTNGASSCPVFDPTNVAGSPFEFLIVAVFAIGPPAWVRRERNALSHR